MNRREDREGRMQARAAQYELAQNEAKRQAFNYRLIALSYHPLVCITYAAGLLYAVLYTT